MSSRPFDPAAFVDLAHDLRATLSGAPARSSRADQAKVRASIGRAYYGTFLAARERLEASGRLTPTRTAQDHHRVATALGGVGTPIGSMLDRLRAKRNQADYNVHPRGMTLQAGQYWLELARQALREVALL